MKKSKKITIIVSSIAMGAILMRFALSKIMGATVSVNQFIEMAQPLGIDPTFFRLLSGVVILIVTLAYLTNAAMLGFKNKLLPYFDKAYILGTLTMGGALLAEFFLRDTPKWVLVWLALAIIILSLMNYFFIKRTSAPKTINQ